MEMRESNSDARKSKADAVRSRADAGKTKTDICGSKAKAGSCMSNRTTSEAGYGGDLVGAKHTLKEVRQIFTKAMQTLDRTS